MSINILSRLASAFLAFLLSITLWVGLTAHTQAKDLPLLLNAVDYSKIESVADCEETLYRGKPRLYSRCLDPDRLFDAAKSFAVENNLPLLIMWGFDSCPACEDQKVRLFDPTWSPTHKTVTSALSEAQKAEFSKYTNGKNQLAVVRMNSGTSLKHNQAFAEKIGANKLASTLGWKKVWSPMFMIVNPETSALASNSYFSSYSFCTMGEEFALGLEHVGIIKADPRMKRICSMPAEPSDEDLATWTSDCNNFDSTKCFWLAKYKQWDYVDSKDDDKAASLIALSEAQALFAKACVDGVALGCYNEGWAVGKKGKAFARQSTDLMKAACKRKALPACKTLASRYFDGSGGLKRNERMAAKLYAEVCEAHDPYACSALGEMAYYRDAGTNPYLLKIPALLAFGCRDDISFACDLQAKL